MAETVEEISVDGGKVRLRTPNKGESALPAYWGQLSIGLQILLGGLRRIDNLWLSLNLLPPNPSYVNSEDFMITIETGEPQLRQQSR